MLPKALNDVGDICHTGVRLIKIVIAYADKVKNSFFIDDVSKGLFNKIKAISPAKEIPFLKFLKLMKFI